MLDYIPPLAAAAAATAAAAAGFARKDAGAMRPADAAWTLAVLPHIDCNALGIVGRAVIPL